MATSGDKVNTKTKKTTSKSKKKVSLGEMIEMYDAADIVFKEIDKDINIYMQSCPIDKRAITDIPQEIRELCLERNVLNAKRQMLLNKLKKEVIEFKF